MSEMVERVARAIRDKHVCDYCTISPDKTLPADCCCYDGARAAIAAMREPTEAMLVAVLKAERGHGNPATLKQHWRTMIDEALR